MHLEEMFNKCSNWQKTLEDNDVNYYVVLQSSIQKKILCL